MWLFQFFHLMSSLSRLFSTLMGTFQEPKLQLLSPSDSRTTIFLLSCEEKVFEYHVAFFSWYEICWNFQTKQMTRYFHLCNQKLSLALWPSLVWAVLITKYQDNFVGQILIRIHITYQYDQNIISWTITNWSPFTTSHA